MAAPSHQITVAREPGSAVAHVRFVSEHRLNPMTRGLVTDLPAVVTFRGGANFSCGAHTGELAGLSEPELTAFVAKEIELFDRVAGLAPVTIAAVTGVCVSNAAELALACDLRLASDDASFAWPEVTLGYPAPVGRLAGFVGRGVATQLAVLGERVGARRAHEIGLVSEVAGAAEFDRRLAELADRAASLPVSAVTQTKGRLDAAYPR